MAKTKQRVLAKTREVLGLLTHHPLESKIDKELFHSMAVSVFRFSAAQVPVTSLMGTSLQASGPSAQGDCI